MTLDVQPTAAELRLQALDALELLELAEVAKSHVHKARYSFAALELEIRARIRDAQQEHIV